MRTHRHSVEVPVELRKRAEELRRRAQGMIDKVSAFRRFDRHRDPDLPQYKQPQLVVATAFEPHGFEAYYGIWEHDYDALSCDVLMFLYAKYRDWHKVLREEQSIQRRRRRFSFVVIPTTLERRLMSLRTWVPEVITRHVSGFVSDEKFLRELGIKPANLQELRVTVSELTKRP